MIDAKRLLDQFLGAGGSDTLGRKAGDVLGGLQRGGAGDMLGNLQKSAADNPMAAKVIAGGLAAILLGSKGRGLTGSAVKLGGLGLIGGLAYKAYQDWQAKQAGQAKAVAHGAQPELAPPPSGSPFAPPPHEEDDRARLLLTAMIAAAKADGTIDADEQKRIFDRLDTFDLDSEDKAYLMDQMRAPLDIDRIAAAARQPEVATEVYAASLLAIDPDLPAEKAYLQRLAARLGLAEALVQEIHGAADAARAPA